MSACDAACAHGTLQCVTDCAVDLMPKIVSWKQVASACGLLVLSGLFSGLTLGLMSLDIRQLELVITGGTAQKRKQAERILPLRKRGNLLLCTLLLANTLVNSGIAILTASFTGGLAGGVVSTGFILIFGEIIPQSVCARYGLAAGAKTVDIIRLIIMLLFPVAWPLSKILDRVLGEELGTIYSRHELKELFSMQAKRASTLENGQGGGGGDGTSGESGGMAEGMGMAEATFMCGVLSLSERTAEMIMTNLDDVFALFTDERLDFPNMSRIYASGYTRVPVFRRNSDAELAAAAAAAGSGGASGTRHNRVQSADDALLEASGGMRRSASDGSLATAEARGVAEASLRSGLPKTSTKTSSTRHPQPERTSNTDSIRSGDERAGNERGGERVSNRSADEEGYEADEGDVGGGDNEPPGGRGKDGEAGAAVSGAPPTAPLRRPPLVVPVAGAQPAPLVLEPPSPNADPTLGCDGNTPDSMSLHDPLDGTADANGKRGWRGHEVAGLLSAKDFILVDPEDALSVDQLVVSCGREVMMVNHDTPVNALFKQFTRGHSHLAFVQRRKATASAAGAHHAESDDPYVEGGSDEEMELIGIVTLEDVLEELIQAEIVDESDVYTDNVSKRYVPEDAAAHQRRLAFNTMLDPKELEDTVLDTYEIGARPAALPPCRPAALPLPCCLAAPSHALPLIRWPRPPTPTERSTSFVSAPSSCDLVVSRGQRRGLLAAAHRLPDAAAVAPPMHSACFLR